MPELFIYEDDHYRYSGSEAFLLCPRASEMFVQDYIVRYRETFPDADILYVVQDVWSKVINSVSRIPVHTKAAVPEGVAAMFWASLVAGECD